MKKRKGAVKKKLISNKVKKTLPYQLLRIALIALIILILIWVVLFMLDRISYLPKDEEGKWTGEFATLKWDFDRDEVTLKVLNYTIYNNNQTIDVNINWSSGDKDMVAILIDFTKPEGNCNYTQTSNLMNFSENITYTILSGGTNCGLSFTNVTDVEAYAEIDVFITQKQNFSNIVIPYINQDSLNVLDLDDYFNCTIDGISYDVNSSGTNIDINEDETSHEIDIYPVANWFGEEEIIVTAYCEGEQSTDLFDVIVLNETGPENNAPSFLDNECAELIWKVNNNFTVDMDTCWEDEDGDSLELSHSSLGSNIDKIAIIEIGGDQLKFVPDNDFIGTSSLYFYANDSTQKASKKVWLQIISATSSTSTTTPTSVDDGTLKIKTASPSGTSVSMFLNTNKSFSITAQNYETIKWYLNSEELVGENNLFYNFVGLEQGNHTIKVEIINGTIVDFKTWNIFIEEDETGFIKSFEAGKVIFYSIMTITIIIILLIVWLFIAEKNSQKRKINYVGFGVNPKSKYQPRLTKGFEGTESSRFNIPTR